MTEERLVLCFAREALMAWRETNRVDDLFGLARNRRLVAEIEAELQAAAELSRETGKRARRFKDLIWSTRDSWSRECRVVAKAEWIGGEANPRFVVTSLRQCAVVVEQPAIKPVNPLEPNPATGPHRGEQGRGQRLELRRRARRAVEHAAEHLARQEIDVLGEHAEAQPVDGLIRMDPPEHDEQRKEASHTVNPMNRAKMESLISGGAPARR
jgi:hypothetical protein